MREIKFRCWRISIKEMYPPASIWKMNLWGCDFTDDIILMQYTGLKDKNGKEIYEGDIIQYQDRTFEVLWCNGGFKIMEMKPGYEGAVDGWIHEIIEGCHCGDTIDSLEIIGNIY